MDKKTYKLKDFAEPIAIAVTDPQKSCHNIFVGLEHYDSGEPVISRFSDTSLLNSSCKEFQKNDILIARRNVYLRRAGIAPFDGLTSGDSIVLRLFEDCEERTGISYDVAIKVIPFVLNSNSFWLYANRHADGMNSKRISKEKVLDYEFDLPSLAEQKVLAEKLWAAYEVKQSYLKMIAATEEMLKAQFIEMIGSKEWPQVQLKDIVHEDCPISYGIVQPGDDIENGVPIVRPIDMTDSHIIDKNALKRTTRQISDSYSRTILRGDEILVCVRGTTGLIALADGLKDCNVTRGITPLYFKPEYNRDYIYRAFLGEKIQKYIQDNTIGSTLKGINMSKLRELPICMPTKDIQEQYVLIANQADKSISELRKSVDAIDKVIKSLINENL